MADIYEPQGIAFLEAYGTFISNELLPLVEKTVTDKKVYDAVLSYETTACGTNPPKEMNTILLCCFVFNCIALPHSGTHLILPNTGPAEEVPRL